MNTRVIQELNCLYFSVDVQQKQASSVFLQQFQSSPEAWEISRLLLLESSHPLEILYFAAQTIRTKIAYDFLQFPKESYDELRQFLFLLFEKFHAAPSALRTQICLGMSDLILQTEDKWEDPILMFFQRYGERIEVSDGLLLFLMLLIEESNNPKIGVNPNSRAHFKATQISRHSQTILLYLSKMITGKNETGLCALKCLKSWIDLKGIVLEDLVQTQIFPLLFSSLRDEYFFEISIDCLSSIIQRAKDSPNRLQILQLISTNLGQISPLLDEAIQSKDEEFLEGFCKLLIEIGDQHAQLILENANNFQFIFNSALEVNLVQIDTDLELNTFAFYFWSCISEALKETNDPSLSSNFVPYFEKLVTTFIPRLSFPLNYTYSFNWLNEFESFRKEIGEALRDCCTVIGGENCLALVLSSLGACINNPTSSWREVESILTFVELISSAVDFERSPSLLPIFQHIYTIATSCSQLHLPPTQLSITKIFASYSRWTRRQSSLLPFQIEYLLALIKINHQEMHLEISKSSLKALHSFSKVCPNQLISHFPSIVETFSTLTFPSIQDRFLADEILSLLISVLPDDQLSNTVIQFLTPIMNDILKISQTPNSVLPLDFVLLTIGRFGVIVQNLKFQVNWSPKPSVQKQQNENHAKKIQAISSFAIQIWPTFEILFQKYAGERTILEALATTISQCFFTCKTNLNSLIASVLNVFEFYFKGTLLAAFLRCTKVILRSLSENQKTFQFQMEDKKLFAKFITNISITLSERTQNQRSEDDPEILVQYFELLSLSLQFFPSFIINWENISDCALETTISLALNALNLQTPEILNSSALYLIHLFELSLYGQNAVAKPRKDSGPLIQRDLQLKQVWENRGQVTLQTIIACICNTLPLVVSWEYFARILELLNYYFGSDIFTQTFLITTNACTMGLLSSEVEEFIQVFTDKGQGHWETVILKVEKFAVLCRRRLGKNKIE